MINTSEAIGIYIYENSNHFQMLSWSIFRILLLASCAFCLISCQNCNNTAQLPGDLRLGACNGSTVCQQLQGSNCINVTCPNNNATDCGIYTCIQGSCKRTGVRSNCCVFNSDCNDGNQCTADVCVSGQCQYPLGGGQCARDWDCRGTTFLPLCLNCTCQPLPTGCSNVSVNGTYVITCNITILCVRDSDCNDNNPCTLDVCQPNNVCAYSFIPFCCTGDSACQANVTNCERISRCNNVTNACYIAPTDADMDGVPCPQDCNDNNPNIGFPLLFYLDADGDGYGSNAQISSCTFEGNFANISGDCDDTNQCVFPGNTQLCWDFVQNDCNASNQNFAECADPFGNDIFFSHVTLGDVPAGGYNGNQLIGLRAYQRPDTSTKLNLIQAINNNYTTFTLYSRDIISISTPVRVDFVLDSLTLASQIPSPYSSYDLFTAEAMVLGTEYIVVYSWWNASTSLMNIKMAICPSGGSFSNFSIVYASPLPGYLVFGRPSISINSTNTILVAYELYSPSTGMFAVVILSNLSSTLTDPSQWSSFFLFNNSYTEPTPIIRLSTRPSVISAFGYNSSGIVTTFFMFGIDVTGTGSGRYAFRNVSQPGFNGAYQMDMELTPDGRPILVALTAGTSQGYSQRLIVTACLSNSVTNYLLTPWNCFQLEEGLGPSVTVVQQRLFVSYWSVMNKFSENNGFYAFDQIQYRLRYTVSCSESPDATSWQFFNTPRTASFVSGSSQNITSPLLASFPHKTAVLPAVFSSSATVALASSNILGVEIDQ